MQQNSEKKLPVKNLERIAQVTALTSYEAALDAKKNKVVPGRKAQKIKIFARHNGTFDVVWYAKVLTEVEKSSAPVSKTVEEVERTVVHGLKAKDRRKKDRKSA